jgi:hypothetical protein
MFVISCELKKKDVIQKGQLLKMLDGTTRRFATMAEAEKVADDFNKKFINSSRTVTSRRTRPA